MYLNRGVGCRGFGLTRLARASAAVFKINVPLTQTERAWSAGVVGGCSPSDVDTGARLLRNVACTAIVASEH